MINYIKQKARQVFSKAPKAPYVPGNLGPSEIAPMKLPPRAERRRAARTAFTPVYTGGVQPVYITPMVMAAKAEKEKARLERKKAKAKKR